MKYTWSLCLCVLVGVAAAGMEEADDESEEEGNVGFKFNKRGGKLRLGRRGGPDEDAAGMEVEFVGLAETNEDGTELPERKPGMRRRAFKAFNKLRWNVTRKGEIDFADLTWRGIEVEAHLRADGNESDAVLKAQVLIAKESGEVMIGEEVQNITRGMIKMNIELNNWEFCDSEDSCTEASEPQAGKAVVLALRIKTKKIGKKLKRKLMGGKGKGKRPEMFEFGENGEFGNVGFSRMVEKDGEVVEMPEGFPKSRDSAKGPGTEVLLFFPRFRSRVVYDPTFETPAAQEDGSTTTPSSQTTTSEVPGSCLISSLLLLVSVIGHFL